MFDLLFDLPIEVFKNTILPLLLVKDLARLDAALNRKREQNILRDLIGKQTIAEEIVITNNQEWLQWIFLRGMRLQKLFLDSSITEESLEILTKGFSDGTGIPRLNKDFPWQCLQSVRCGRTNMRAFHTMELYIDNFKIHDFEQRNPTSEEIAPVVQKLNQLRALSIMLTYLASPNIEYIHLLKKNVHKLTENIKLLSTMSGISDFFD